MDYNVADLSLAEFGRKQINLAEREMPGLMAMTRAIFRVRSLEFVLTRVFLLEGVH